jgi:predicted ATPase/DNA-binding CsgD family transcriptional regulator
MGQAALLTGPATGLPAEVTGFIGRRSDRARVRQLLSQSRVVTLTGFGGIGKTRLALRVANDLARVYADGVRWVALGDLPDAEHLIEATAAALGLHDQAAELDLGQLVDQLRTRELLIVLDNCEHVIDETAEMVTALLGSCPRLHVLATSREALRVDGEAVHQVSPFSVPVSAEDDAWSGSEAVRLLVDRAGQAVPDFTAHKRDRTSLVGICRHLDGIPLALELAAVRLRVLSPDDLLGQLKEHWELLDVGTRGAPKRHRTMSACLDWSHTLCTAEERDLWAVLGVFSGTMDRESIEAVAVTTLPSMPRHRILQVIQQLVDKSILTMQTQDDHARYSMLEILRRFGRERLEDSGLLAAALVHHRNWYAGRVRTLHESWMSPAQTDLLAQARRDEANLRVALTYCSHHPEEARAGLEMAARLRMYAVAHGLFSEGRSWLRKLLAKHAQQDHVRLLGLRASCWLAALQGDIVTTESLLPECRQLAEELRGEGPALADQVTGLCAMAQGDLPVASVNLERALDAFRAEGHTQRQAETLILLAMTSEFAGDLDRATALHAECQQLCSAAGESWLRSYSLWHAGLVSWRRGDLARAVEQEREGLALKQMMGERFGIALCLEALAWMQAPTAPSEAATLLGAADALWASVGTSVAAVAGLQPRQEECRALLTRELTSDFFDRAFTEGRRLDEEGAIALALGEARPAGRRTSLPGDGAASSLLTKRQREIAALVAGGLTNKEIAGKLVISPRTAEAHVENIMTKLGFTSRTQVAVWMAEHHVEPPATT